MAQQQKNTQNKQIFGGKRWKFATIHPKIRKNFFYSDGEPANDVRHESQRGTGKRGRFFRKRRAEEKLQFFQFRWTTFHVRQVKTDQKFQPERGSNATRLERPGSGQNPQQIQPMGGQSE